LNVLPSTRAEATTDSANGAHGASTLEAPPVVEVKDVTKRYRRGNEVVDVLTNFNLRIMSASFEALMGPSGSGKTTLLNLIAGLDAPTLGTVSVAGTNLASMTEDELAAWRGNHVGFVFQTFNLMPGMTALQNVALPLLLSPLSRLERRKRAQFALEMVGLADRENHYPNELSGGQEQRVAIARAIVTDPLLIVADEPTGDLDRASAHEVLDLLEALRRQFGKTVVMVTHDPAAAERATTVHRLDKVASA
jgi:putative ABC transport system ATP-binding protein